MLNVFLVIHHFALIQTTKGCLCCFCKGQVVNIFSFADHTVPTATTQLCYWSGKAVIDNM